MIDPQTLETTLQAIVADLDGVATVAAGVDPALVPFIAIGKAIDAQIPGLAGEVAGWIEGNKPTAAEITQKAQELSVLGDKGGV